MDRIVIYTDGACSGNPGPGGWAFVAPGPGGREASGGEKLTTNNRMELVAVTRALEYADSLGKPVEIRTDSQYVKNGIETWIKNWKRNGWRTASKQPVKNQELWTELDALAAKTGAVFTWVEGHAGVEHNERCDELARAEVDRLR